MTFATYMLKLDAEFWCKGAKSLMESDQREINWDAFKAAIYEKYFLLPMRIAKEIEFLRLYQGGMGIAEYTAKFEELCKFSTLY